MRFILLFVMISVVSAQPFWAMGKFESQTTETQAVEPISPLYDYTFARARTYNNRVRHLILHYTSAQLDRSLSSLTERFSSHYLVSLNGDDDPTYKKLMEDRGYSSAKARVFSLVDEDKRAWQAGVSAWGTTSNLNDSSIGIEIINDASKDERGVFTFPPYPDYQIELVKNILERYDDIDPTKVLAHSDVAYWRGKVDPGPRFPWKRLYEEGIGAWYEEADVKDFRALLDRGDLSYDGAIKRILDYGFTTSYQRAHKATIDQWRLVRAFQLHYRQSNYDGILDEDTAATMYALWAKYKGKPTDEELMILTELRSKE